MIVTLARAVEHRRQEMDMIVVTGATGNVGKPVARWLGTRIGAAGRVVAADIDCMANRPSDTAGQCGGARRGCVDSLTRNWRQRLVIDAEHAIGRFGPSVAGDEQKFVLAGGRTDETVVERAAGQAYFG
jgi:nucleoside-diphosphate-sugar epimerase